MMPENVIIRDTLLEALRPLLPAKVWRIVPTQRTADPVQKRTVVIRQQRIEREPSQPRRARRAYFDIVLASPLDNTGAAEHDLDDRLVDFLNALDTIGGVTWTEATKGVWSEQNPAPCYVVELWIPYHIEKG